MNVYEKYIAIDINIEVWKTTGLDGSIKAY